MWIYTGLDGDSHWLCKNKPKRTINGTHIIGSKGQEVAGMFDHCKVQSWMMPFFDDFPPPGVFWEVKKLNKIILVI